MIGKVEEDEWKINNKDKEHERQYKSGVTPISLSLCLYYLFSIHSLFVLLFLGLPRNSIHNFRAHVPQKSRS